MAWEIDYNSFVQVGQRSSRHSPKRAQINKRRSLITASWNVRTLVENTGGDRRICRSRPQHVRQDTVPSDMTTGHHCVDRKLDLLVKELKQYQVSVAAIQETKWFGKDIWQADGYQFITSGCPLPSDGESAVRNEGVGIVLDEEATAAWKEAG